ncbi:MAG: hypothetical protein ACOX7B_14880 [Christensenellales bacterium]|jgi:hypothetical protein
MKAEIVHINGVANISINGKIISSVSFRSFWPQANIIADLYENGIKLMSIFPSGILNSLDVPYSQFGEYWIGEEQYDWDVLRRQIDQFISNAPEAYLSLILQLDTRDWFLENHPKCQNSFDWISNACGYQPWRDAARQCIRDTLTFIDREYPEKLYAVYVCAGGTCEWINRHHNGNDPLLSEDAFRRYTKDPRREMPSSSQLLQGAYGSLMGKDDQNVVDYWRCVSDIIADTIEEFSREVKLYNPGLLVGCFSGYLMTFGEHIAAAGHLHEQRIAKCPDIDIVFSPASYKLRGLESVSNSHVPMSSMHINGKLYYHEIDNTTYSANSNPYAQVLQRYAHRRHATMSESIHYTRREAARVFAELGTYWWFDMFGGWYNDPELQEALFQIGKAQEKLYSAPISSNAQVAFLVDEESHRHISKNNLLHRWCVEEQLEPLGRIGCMIDYYATDDLLLPHFPREQYKLYIFPDLVAPTEGIRKAIATLRAQGASMLFLYAPGFLRDGVADPIYMKELTGLDLIVFDGKQGYSFAPSGAYNDNGMGRVFGGMMDSMQPTIIAEEPSQNIIAKGLVNEKAHMIVKDRVYGGFDAWAAQGPLPEYILRPLARHAGAFIWQEDSLPVYTNSRMVSLFDHQGGFRELRVPWHSGRITELYTGETHQICEGEPVHLTFHQNECKTFIYLKNGEEI